MKRAFLLIVIPALVLALGFSQTPTPSVNTDQTNIKGCLGGSDGNYTVSEDGTGRTFKITTSGVDLKQHLGHDVTLIGHRASGTSSAAADNSFAVTELTMISEHCAPAAAPTVAVNTTSETASTPAAPPAPAAAVSSAAAPTTSTSTLPETAITPAADASAGAMAATVTTPAEPTLTPVPLATPPAETTVTPTVAPATTASTPWDKPAADAAPPTRRAERSRSVSAPAVAVAGAPAVTASKSSEPASTPDVAATTPATNDNSSETVTTPGAVPTKPPVPARHGALWLLIAFVVLVIALGTFVPFLNRWRKQKSMARIDAPNLSFTREASTDQDKKDSQEPRKAA